MWTEAYKDPTLLSLGLTLSVKLEGVDGKRDDVGSGREGPIDDSVSRDLPCPPPSTLTRVTIEIFTSEHLAKHNVVLSTAYLRLVRSVDPIWNSTMSCVRDHDVFRPGSAVGGTMPHP